MSLFNEQTVWNWAMTQGIETVRHVYHILGVVLRHKEIEATQIESRFPRPSVATNPCRLCPHNKHDLKARPVAVE